MKQKFKSKSFILYSICFILILASPIAIWLNGADTGLLRSLRIAIEKTVISEDPIPQFYHIDAIYILGGPPASLEFKFLLAGSIYEKGICNRIILQSQHGVTEYSLALKRNLMKDEWALMKLERVGINPDDVEAVNLKEGFFGTFSEAREISNLVESRGFQNIGLISGAYHTRRVRISFEKFLKEREVEVSVFGSSERVGLTQLLIELIKLKAYQWFLL